MDTQYKDYKFKIEEATSKQLIDAYQAIKVYKKEVNGEILLLSLNGAGSFSLYLQDRFFTLTIDDETKRISSFDGELTNKQIKFLRLKLPSIIKDAILTLDTKDELFAGTGSYIEFNTKNIIYDKGQKILQIGDIAPKDIIYKFFNNAFVQINNGKLLGLMFTEIEL